MKKYILGTIFLLCLTGCGNKGNEVTSHEIGSDNTTDFTTEATAETTEKSTDDATTSYNTPIDADEYFS